MRRKTLYVVLGLVAIALVAGGLIWRERQQSTRAMEDLRSAVVERGDMLVAVSASGHVRPAEQAELSFNGSGQVVEVPVEVGDEVDTGDIMARLDTERLALEVERAEANLAAAEAQLTRLRAGTPTEETETVRANLRAAEAQLSAATADRDQLAAGPEAAQIAAAEAEVASALTEQKKADDLHETTMECRTIKISKGDPIKLPSGEVIPVPESILWEICPLLGTPESIDWETCPVPESILREICPLLGTPESIEREICPLLGVPEEQARYRLEAANEALEAARARLQDAQDGADQDQLRAAQANVASAAAKRDAAQAQLDLVLEGPTDEQIAAAEGGVAQAHASLSQAELALEHAVLRAPFGATVAAVDVAVGSQASVGQPAVTLVDATQFHINVAVDEMDVRRLERGQTARLTFDALPDTVVTGTVEHIATAAELDGGVVTYDVRVDLAPTDAPIRTDMTTSATVILEELNDVLKIPTWAVRVDPETGGYYVHRRTEDGIERVDVRLGARYEESAEVLDGLSAGEEIVRLPESSPFDFGADLGR